MKRRCQQCYRSFSTVSNLRRHERLHNRVNLGKKTDITKCPKCMKTCSSYSSRMRHETSCITVHHHPLSPKLTYARPICNHHFVSFSKLVNHQERTNMCRVEAGGSSVSEQNTPSQPVSSHHSNSETKRKSVQCRTCHQDFQSYVDLYNHRMIDHMQSVGIAASFQPLPWEKYQSLPRVNEDVTVNEKLKKNL